MAGVICLHRVNVRRFIEGEILHLFAQAHLGMILDGLLDKVGDKVLGDPVVD